MISVYGKSEAPTLTINMSSWRDEYLDRPRDTTRGECLVSEDASSLTDMFRVLPAEKLTAGISTFNIQITLPRHDQSGKTGRGWLVGRIIALALRPGVSTVVARGRGRRKDVDGLGHAPVLRVARAWTSTRRVATIAGKLGAAMR